MNPGPLALKLDALPLSYGGLLENVAPVHHIHSSDMRNLILNATKGANF